MAPGHIAFDWKRLSRYCLLGTFIMFVWLMVPVTKCSFAAFRDTPLSELDANAAPSAVDTNRIDQSQSFVGKVVDSAKLCYARTPLLGQEGWKGNLLLAFAAGTVLTWLMHRWDTRRRRTIG